MMQTLFRWYTLHSTSNHRTCVMPVPGGTLIRHVVFSEVEEAPDTTSMVFVPGVDVHIGAENEVILIGPHNHEQALMRKTPCDG